MARDGDMKINSIATLLGCAGLLAGGIGIVAQGNSHQATDHAGVQGNGVAWPADASQTGVQFHDEMVKLMSRGPRDSRHVVGAQDQTRAVPPEGDASIRRIRTIRSPGSRRTELVEIEFVDRDARSYLRYFPVDQVSTAGDRPNEFEGNSSAESYAYSPRRSRRYGRSYFRRRW